MQNNSVVSIVMVTFNSFRYLPAVFEALKKQTIYGQVEVIVVDNNSDNETRSFLSHENIVLIENDQNVGFAKANNQGITQAQGEYVLCLNHDVVLAPDYIEKSVAFFMSHESVGSLSGFIKKWDFKNDVFTEQVDTLGFKLFKSHKVIDQSELDFNGEESQEVFGVSAAVVMYSMKAIRELQKISDHFFDDSFGSYKEDIDVAFRLRHAGFTSYVLKDVVAYHDRWETGSGEKGVSPRKNKSALINRMSYENHLTVLLKNQLSIILFKYSIFILFFEVKKFIYFLFFERPTLFGLFDFIKTISLTLKKRHDIVSTSKMSSSDMARWLS